MRWALLVFFIYPWSFAEVYNPKLLYRIEDNNITISLPKLKYDFSSDEEFSLEGRTFRYRDISPQKGTLKLSFASVYENRNFYESLLGLRWPQELIDKGKVEFVTPRYGKTLYSEEFSQKKLEEWVKLPEKITGDREYLSGKAKEVKFKEEFPLEEFEYGFYPIPEKLESVIRKTFRFCIRNTARESKIVLCSPNYRLNRQGQFQMVSKRYIKRDTVAVNGKRAPLTKEIEFGDQKVSYSVWKRNGFVLGFEGTSLDAQIAQVLDGEDGIEVIGFGTPPKGAVPLSNSENFFKDFVWKDTIEPEKKYWKLNLEKNSRKIPALAGGMDLVFFEIETPKLPSKKEHSLELKNARVATYLRRPIFKGNCARDCSLESFDSDKVVTEGKEFTWELELNKKNKKNRKKLKLLDGENQWVASYDIFRASSTEISSRFTGLVTTDGAFTVLYELHLSHWFESFLGWQNNTLSVQRWGASVRHFSTATDLPFGVVNINWSSTNADLKYRLFQGVWGLQESVGLMASYQKTTVSHLSVDLLGGGVFWAKSMPEIFDRIISWIPYMNYPKWVDMEFVYFPSGFGAVGVEPQPMWNLSFHGKVLWTPSFYGELGFGMRKIDIIDRTQTLRSQDLRFQFTAAYITLGIGVQF